MNDKIERIRMVSQLNKTGDLSNSESMEKISNILSEKGFYKGMTHYEKKSEIKVIGNRRNQKWTKDDEHLLIYYKNKGWGWKSIGNKLHKTPDACRVKATVLGLYSPRKYKRMAIPKPKNGDKAWTEEEDNILRRCFSSNYSYPKMAMKLGRSRHAIECRKTILGLGYNQKNLPYRPSKPIQSWEDDEVIELYKLKAERKTNREIAEQLGKTVKQIGNKLYVMKLSGGFDAWKAKRGYN